MDGTGNRRLLACYVVRRCVFPTHVRGLRPFRALD